MQRQLDAISSAYSRAGLVVNSKKTEVLCLPSDSSLPPTFYISGDQRGFTEQFTYLGSIITSTCDLTAEIQYRVNLASASFGRLSKLVLRTMTFPHAPRWPFTTQSLSRHCSMHLRDGHRTVDTSEPSRPFTFRVFKLSCTCTGKRQRGRKAPVQYATVFGPQSLDCGATIAYTRKRVEQRHRRTDGQLRKRKSLGQGTCSNYYIQYDV